MSSWQKSSVKNKKFALHNIHPDGEICVSIIRWPLWFWRSCRLTDAWMIYINGLYRTPSTDTDSHVYDNLWDWFCVWLLLPGRAGARCCGGLYTISSLLYSVHCFCDFIACRPIISQFFTKIKNSSLLISWLILWFQAISLAILVGTSVDYCVHLVEGYRIAGKTQPPITWDGPVRG